MTHAKSNNRRRFLAFLGLAGLPAALWSPARAQTGGAAADPTLYCQARVSNANAYAEYFRSFTLTNGTLVGDPGADGTMKLVEGALDRQFAAGYESVGDAPAGAEYNDSGPRFTIDGAEYPELMNCSFIMTLKTPKAPTSVSLMQVFSDTDVHETAATSDPTDGFPNNVVISGSWDPPALNTLTDTFYIRVMADGVAVAQFGFNFATLNWKDVQNEANKEFNNKTGVTVDAATGETNVPNCTVSTDPGCFFTTAASHTLGLSDDCWELRTLRAFRDGPLSKTAEGCALTARYYAEAPRLVDGINARRDAARIWLSAYWTHILPCAVMAHLGLHEAAIAHYTRLFDRLERLAG